ncbi:translational activator of cytochrome c oxidase 1-like [Tubulanus polymorphus]|uniref:translational activator of cytochrome c oxidase 1-like n=1 Tax=Tubulanus polymorphus TaxID=672921 RepID=UPI003DA537F5
MSLIIATQSLRGNLSSTISFMTRHAASSRYSGAVIQRQHVASFYTNIKLYAGHSKWQNIRHIKAAKDKERMNMTSKIVLKMNIAIKEGGSADPKLNRQLERAILEAESKDVPKSTIQNALKRAGEKSKDGKVIHVEMKGPGNCFLIVEVLTDKATRTRQKIQNILKSTGGQLLDNGMTRFSFDYKGIAHLPYEGEENLDTAMEHAIEAGAEDVQSVLDSSGRNVYEFHCDTKDLHKMTKHLESTTGKTVTHSKLEYVPTNFVKLNKNQLEFLSILYDKLDNFEDPVLSIYDNVEPDVE